MTLVKYKRINCNRAISGLSGNLLALLCVWASAFVVIAPTNGLLYLLIAPVALLSLWAVVHTLGKLSSWRSIPAFRLPDPIQHEIDDVWSP
jgi:hypothetical protein